jgi:hypothetical protein
MSQRKMQTITDAWIVPWEGTGVGIQFVYDHGRGYSGHQMPSLEEAQRQCERLGEQVPVPPPPGTNDPGTPAAAPLRKSA